MFEQLRTPKAFRIYHKRSRSRRLHRWISNYSELWANIWLWELLSIILSGVCIFFIFAILFTYDQKPVPQLIYGITINALISVLTTFSKSLLLVAAAGAISQLKWRWFQSIEGRRIIDAQLFDDASRGPWGSLVFLAAPSRWSLASIGAAVSLNALAFEPFTQQLTTYPVREVVVSTPGVGPLTLYRAKSYFKDEITQATVNGLQSRSMAAVWDTSNEAQSFATVQCPTGNCTWEDFESLAFCTLCQNETSGIELSDTTLSWNSSVAQQVESKISEDGLGVASLSKSFSLHLPGDFSCSPAFDSNLTITAQLFNNKSEHYISPSSFSYPRHLFRASAADYWDIYQFRDLAFRNSRFLANSSDFLKWQSRRLPLIKLCHTELETESDDGLEKISAKQTTFCDLTLCVKKYSFSILNGIPRVDTVGERYGSWYFNTTGLKVNLSNLDIKPSWIDIPGRNGFILNENGTNPYTDLSSKEFSLSLGERDIVAFQDIESQFGGQLLFYEYFAKEERNRISNNTGVQFNKSFLTSSAVDRYIDGRASTLSHIVNNGGLTWAAPRLAAASSRYLRDIGTIPVEGHAYKSIIIVEVRWLWLILPATTWLCGVVFLALTMWFCRGSDRMLWKTSSLPLIYHGFEDQDVAAIKTTGNRLEHVSGMEKYSQNLYARIRRDSNDGQLKLMRTLPPHVSKSMHKDTEEERLREG